MLVSLTALPKPPSSATSKNCEFPSQDLVPSDADLRIQARTCKVMNQPSQANRLLLRKKPNR
ncbi:MULTISPECIES: hypothetical protein [Cyanophyceae]|uniref:hypothetical protein n=1 Tax=Cyanophyceae TaxID=3028117 RepID=UPI001687315F|nr:hypothetical protein [Trichocoleus sp. FACHB-69]MBD1934553.1 hypothetical protein [Trichocoleus sp. FACHB-69]